MKIRRLEEAEKTEPAIQGAKGVTKQVPLSRSDGAPNFSFRVFTLVPGGHTPYHSHPQEHLNYILEGEGVVVGENQVERSIRKGDFVLVLPGEMHQYRNTSREKELMFICAVMKEYE